MAQTRKKQERQDDEAPQTGEKSAEELAAEAEEREKAVTAVLDEIDEVLEENAEDFVRGFVQKGGE